MTTAFPSAREADLTALNELVLTCSPVSVLTGAGCSTESGIPDYRGPDGTWQRRRPMQYGEFMRSETSRRHYWARNYVGWPVFDSAAPNDAHVALAAIEELGHINTLITQNVDPLHRRAGSRNLIELHGQSDRVLCTGCGTRSPRALLQERMRSSNPGWSVEVDQMNPDADAELDRERTASFVVPSCEQCGGVLKPDVVFFGENVPPTRVADAMAALESSGALIVAGSSLAVWSGFRFAKRAHEIGIPVVIVNCGETRADDIATLRVTARCSDTFSRLAARLEARYCSSGQPCETGAKRLDCANLD